MKLRCEWAFALSVLAAACGGDDTVDANARPGAPGVGACGKGELKVTKGEIAFCGSDFDESCPSTKELAGYTSVSGDISIYPDISPDLSDASCLQSVATTLSISGGTEITSLAGLENLKFARALEVLGLDKLRTLAGIDQLTHLNSLTVNGNLLLTDLQGLPAGFTVGSLYVAGNSELNSLDGLAHITVTEVVAIENNSKLSSCKVAEFAKKFSGVELSNFGNLTTVCN